MIIDQILEVARPYLENRTVSDAVLGLSLIGIELDNEDIGLSYMLREKLPAGCSSFGFAQEIIGMNAYELGKLARDGKDDAQRGVGMAVLTAASRQLDLEDEDDQDPYFGLDVKNGDIVGMIGYIPPVAKRFSQKASQVYVFDKGISTQGLENIDKVEVMDRQDELLPKCDLVIMTGTTITNQSIDSLLDICSSAREIVLVGSSTPMYPEAFKGTKVNILAGSWWDNSDKEELFKRLSLSCGISHLREFMIKKAVRV